MYSSSVLLIVSLFSTTTSIIIVDRIEINTNPNIVNMTIELLNDGVHSTLINSIFQTKVVLTKIKMITLVKVPEDNKDHKYLRVIYRVSMDIGEYIIKGTVKNMFTQKLSDGIIKALDFEPRFPFPIGTFSISNYTPPDDLLKMLPTTRVIKGMIESRYDVKILNDKRKSVIACSWKAYGEVRPNKVNN
ncbi:CLUMA_CG007639, isoform A [Clunio marinus]|uniref:CLUMA_CG007639, isoform A n=1 Tax=Clunio marinus TaxID=568069 RepID=A0A1J1I3E6_9DIPT|nr:CLUMA_CG007639, isoform A [Clunio marinus]